MTKKEETKRFREQLTRWMGHFTKNKLSKNFTVEELMESSLSNLELWVQYIDKRTLGGKMVLEAYNRKKAEG